MLIPSTIFTRAPDRYSRCRHAQPGRHRHDMLDQPAPRRVCPPLHHNISLLTFFRALTHNLYDLDFEHHPLQSSRTFRERTAVTTATCRALGSRAIDQTCSRSYRNITLELPDGSRLEVLRRFDQNWHCDTRSGPTGPATRVPSTVSWCVPSSSTSAAESSTRSGPTNVAS